MTTAEKYRQLEKSPAINIARYIFSCVKKNATNSTLGNEIVEIKTGKTPSKQNKRFYEDDFLNWFKPDEIGSDKYLFEAKDKLSKFTYENNQATIYEPDTILINAIGDIGRISILKVKASSNQQITGIRLNNKIDVEYAYFYLLANRHFFYVDLFQTTLPIVNQKKINSIPFVYPNIEEQRNIVEGLVEIDKINSVDDLYIIEKLNWNEDYKNACRNFFSVQFNSNNISSELTHQLTLVKKLRQQLLQDAVQGKLLSELGEKGLKDDKIKTHILQSNNPKNHNSDNGHELLKKIKAALRQAQGDKKGKKQKELPPIKPEEIPFEIPENWVWCRLGEMSINLDGQRIPVSQSERERKEKIYDYYGASGVIDKIDNFTHDGKFVLIGEDGANLIAKSTPIAFIAEGKFWVNNHAHVLDFIDDITIYFMTYCLNAIDIKPYITGGFQPKLSQGNLNSILIPLPPLAEQTRIVQKLDELMQHCNELEASIKQSQAQNSTLLQQVLREALRKEPVGEEV